MRLSDELRQRTKAFASRTVRLFISLPRSKDDVAVLSKQMLRSVTSVAAHAREASRARSEADLCSKLDVLLQEANEPERSGDRHPFGCPQGDEGIKLSYG
jgi:four helix bundle protein